MSGRKRRFPSHYSVPEDLFVEHSEAHEQRIGQQHGAERDMDMTPDPHEAHRDHGADFRDDASFNDDHRFHDNVLPGAHGTYDTPERNLRDLHGGERHVEGNRGAQVQVIGDHRLRDLNDWTEHHQQGDRLQAVDVHWPRLANDNGGVDGNLPQLGARPQSGNLRVPRPQRERGLPGPIPFPQPRQVADDDDDDDDHGDDDGDDDDPDEINPLQHDLLQNLIGMFTFLHDRSYYFLRH